jgi:hypothetical protein
MESVLGKSACMDGELGDATPFTSNSIDIATALCDRLEAKGFERTGTEVLYNGLTGEPMGAFFMGMVYYQRLKHMVSDKVHCLTPTHDVLCIDGWKPINLVSLKDRVATLNNDGELVYTQPTHIHHYPNYSGQMYKVKSPWIELDVTNNHRMFVAQTPESNYSLEVAESIQGKHRYYKNSAWWNIDNYQFLLPGTDLLPELKPDMTAWLQFTGLLILGGTVNSKRILLRSITEETFKIANTALSTLHFDSTCDPSEGLWHITDQRVIQYFTTLAHGSDKGLPPWAFLLSAEQARTFLDAIIVGYQQFKSLRCNPGDIHIFTSSRQMASDLAQLCLHGGYCSRSCVTQTGYKVEIYREKIVPDIGGSEEYKEKSYEYQGSIVFQYLTKYLWYETMANVFGLETVEHEDQMQL